MYGIDFLDKGISIEDCITLIQTNEDINTVQYSTCTFSMEALKPGPGQQFGTESQKTDRQKYTFILAQYQTIIFVKNGDR